MPPPTRLAHDVYFRLDDPSPAAKRHLVEQCYLHLADIDVVESLCAGTRNPDLARDVNDLDYDVSLHVVFKSRADHDAYQDAPAHQAFIAANQDSWRSVRVFDSDLHAR